MHVHPCDTVAEHLCRGLVSAWRKRMAPRAKRAVTCVRFQQLGDPTMHHIRPINRRREALEGAPQHPVALFSSLSLSPSQVPVPLSCSHRAVAAARQNRLPLRVGEGATRDVVGVTQEAADERLCCRSVPDLEHQEKGRIKPEARTSEYTWSARGHPRRSWIGGPECYCYFSCTNLLFSNCAKRARCTIYEKTIEKTSLTTSERSAPQDTRNMLSPLHATSHTGNPSWCPVSSRTLHP